MAESGDKAADLDSAKYTLRGKSMSNFQEWLNTDVDTMKCGNEDCDVRILKGHTYYWDPNDPSFILCSDCFQVAEAISATTETW